MLPSDNNRTGSDHSVAASSANDQATATGPSPAASHRAAGNQSLRLAIVTVSDTRTISTDRSGQILFDAMHAAGHQIVKRQIVRDEETEIADLVKSLSASEARIDVILLTGGTGIAPRDRTPEAIRPLLDLELPGFGELFRALSFQEIGPAAMLSRAFAGRIGPTLIFALPGSTNAVRLAADQILAPELGHLVYHSRG